MPSRTGSTNISPASRIRSAARRCAQDRQYAGFDAYKYVIDQVDLVLLATPPQFRPLHLAYAVEKGVHAFVEKPMAVDGPGLRKFLEACKALRPRISLWSTASAGVLEPRRQTMKRVFDGQIGDIVAIETTYNSQGVWEPRKTREQCGSDMEYQLRNWYYYCWLSGDHIVEQAVHGLDTMGWVMGDKPPSSAGAWAAASRAPTPSTATSGTISRSFTNTPATSAAITIAATGIIRPPQVQDYLFGTKGTADVFDNIITGPSKWRYRVAPRPNMYQVEHDEMFAAIRAGKPINNGEKAAASTLLALMGRTAAYTGEVITPEMILNSKSNLGLPVANSARWPRHPCPCPGQPSLLEARPRVRVFPPHFSAGNCKTLASGSTTTRAGSNGQMRTTRL